jgi:peptidase E
MANKKRKTGAEKAAEQINGWGKVIQQVGEAHRAKEAAFYPHAGRLRHATSYASDTYDRLRKIEMSIQLAHEGALDREVAQRINDNMMKEVFRNLEYMKSYLEPDEEDKDE